MDVMIVVCLAALCARVRDPSYDDVCRTGFSTIEG
jgi:hypothetical protein